MPATDHHDLTFACMGGDVRLIVDTADGGDARSLGASARGHLDDLDARLSRFRPDSELCLLNSDPRTTVPATPLLRAWLRAALWAADRTDGLVDPTLVAALEAAGYRDSLAGATPIDLDDALRVAPARRRASAATDSGWRAITVDDEAGTIARPPGVRLDSGGTGKGFAADSAARLLHGADRFAVDCAGDIAVGGSAGELQEIRIEHPLTREEAHTATLAAGGIATSGIDRHLWRTPDGGVAHHLLDPATGTPAWTGLISVTVVAASVLEAETLAKAALLAGPDRARRVLRGRDAVLVHDDGDVELNDARRQTVTFSMSAAR